MPIGRKPAGTMESILPRLRRPLSTLALLGWYLAVVLAAVAQDKPAPSGAAEPPVPPSPLSGPDAAWHTLKEAERTGAKPDETGSANAKAGRLALADQARDFYRAHGSHPQAGEARCLELFALLQAEAEGQPGLQARLAQAAGELRGASQVAAAIRARGVAAYEFAAANRTRGTAAERLAAIETTARALLREFPGEPQGPQALLAVANAASADRAVALAEEVVRAEAPPELKQAAQRLLERMALVGGPLTDLLEPAAREALAQVQKSNEPVLVYSWATGAPGSLELGRMIQARRFGALGICLDDDLDAARREQAQANLGGTHVYDAAGRSGRQAARLLCDRPGMIYLVDGQGVIRDVRGNLDLETKLKALGFSTPVLTRPVVTP